MAKITDMTIRNMKAESGKTTKLTIDAGLQVWATINRAGKTAKAWYLRYYDAAGKRQLAKIGEYPELTLAKALALAEDLKAKAKSECVNLAQEKAKAKRVIVESAQAVKENTFENVATAWLNKKNLDWDPDHAKRQKERLTANIFPAFGETDINAVTMQDIDTALLSVIARGSRETAQRICTIIRSIFDYADTMDILADPSIIRKIERYRKDMPQPVNKSHLYKEMSEQEIGKLLYLIEETKMRWTL